MIICDLKLKLYQWVTPESKKFGIGTVSLYAFR